MVLFSSLGSQCAFANEGVASASISGNGMAVVLTPGDIQHGEDADNPEVMTSHPIDGPKNESGDNNQNATSNLTDANNPGDKSGTTNTNGKNENSTVTTSTLTPAPEHDDFKDSLPQVVRQTQSIGTVDNPTIDGGLISAPELTETLPESGQGNAVRQDGYVLEDTLYQINNYVTNFTSDDVNAGLSKIILKAEMRLQKARQKMIYRLQRYFIHPKNRAKLKEHTFAKKTAKVISRRKAHPLNDGRVHHANG